MKKIFNKSPNQTILLLLMWSIIICFYFFVHQEFKSRMNQLYFTKPYRGSLKKLRLEFGEVKNNFLLKFVDGEINIKGKSQFSPIEEVFDDEQEMLKKVWETRKQLSEERWILKTKEDSPKTTQPSFITLKTIDGELSLEYDN